MFEYRRVICTPIHLHVTCSQKYLYCALKMHENVKHYFNRYFKTIEYRADFPGIYSLGVAQRLGSHWTSFTSHRATKPPSHQATKTLHIPFTLDSRLLRISQSKKNLVLFWEKKLKTIHRLSKQALSIYEKKNRIL